MIQFERKYTVSIRERKGLYAVLTDLLDACIPFAVECVSDTPVVEWEVSIPEHWRSFLARRREVSVVTDRTAQRLDVDPESPAG